MKIKDKIIKLFGGYTKEEYDILEDKYKNTWMKRPNPTILKSTEKQIHNIELSYELKEEELKSETIKFVTKDQLKRALICKLDDFIEFEESDYEIKLLLQVVK